ncbi:MAG: phosphoribosyl-AMP cyclohydrolase [Clostridia bacterium]|nr:phosphoribosyl-AMP cyclohydrolase [Clostridia bacterium]
MSLQEQKPEDNYREWFDRAPLIPAILQEESTGEVLMLAYMNLESFERTLQSGKCTFWSRSRQALWCKGETSGHYQYVRRILYDCDCDTLLILVSSAGPACHTGHKSCFYREYPYIPKDNNT